MWFQVVSIPPPPPSHGRSLEISSGTEVLKAKLLEEKYEATLEFPGGKVVQNKKTFCEERTHGYFLELHIQLACQPREVLMGLSTWWACFKAAKLWIVSLRESLWPVRGYTIPVFQTFFFYYNGRPSSITILCRILVCFFFRPNELNFCMWSLI